MNDEVAVKGRRKPTSIMLVGIGVIVGLVLVIVNSNRVPELMTCQMVDGEGLPTLTCTSITHNNIRVRGRYQSPRVTRFADVSGLNPGSTVIASIELSAGAGVARIQFMFERDRWGSFSTDITRVDNAVAETETEIVVTNNRVEFIIDGGREVRLNVAFTNPVEPDEDEITVTQEPFISILKDDEEGITKTQEAFISIVGDETELP